MPPKCVAVDRFSEAIAGSVWAMPGQMGFQLGEVGLEVGSIVGHNG